MATTRSSQKRSPKNEPAAEVIELSSDSEAEVPEANDEIPEPDFDDSDLTEQPLLKAAGIKYKTDKPQDEEPEHDQQTSPSNSKLAVRVRDTGSAKHRHVSIEIPLPTSSGLRRKRADAASSQEGNDEEVFKTPKERKHITFDDSDYDEFVTPKEAPSGNPLETSANSAPKGQDAGEGESDEEEESDDDAPPEDVSTRDAAAETVKASEAAAKAREQQDAALKRKRRERDAFLKQQAEERKRTQKAARQEDDEDDVTPESETRKQQVPKLLPLEFLESDDEDDSSREPSSAAQGQHKRRKLGAAEHALLRDPKLPKDKRIGSTAYRVVAATSDTRLAPKVKKQAVNLRETLLQRDRVPRPRGGFFVR